MADFPTSIPSFSTVNSSTPVASTLINTIQNELVAIATKVGIGSSAVTTSHDYKFSLVTSTAKALPDSYLDTDGTLAANSDTKIATQKAVKTYADTKASNSDLTTHMSDTSTHGVSTIAGISETQTLSEKTLTAPKIVSGGFIADANGNEQIIFTTTASAVNEITITNAATGSAVAIQSTGGDTNIALVVKGKGTGAVRLGQATSTDVRLEADQPIADSSGNELIKFVKTASAVNEVQITNAATANAPIIEATGGDTNIHLVARGKGNGLTKVSILRQDNTTNAYKHNSVILTGWGYDTSPAAQVDSETVTFGITFAAAPIVLVSRAGGRNSTTPTTIADLNQDTNHLTSNVVVITTTTFDTSVRSVSIDGLNPGNIDTLVTYWAYTWIAIGELT